jgi:hypothetical protein
MRVLSLGAGVQSSALLLKAAHGDLQIDRAVFADTQAEPPAVYAYLELLMPIAERAGIPVDIVTAGDLGTAVLSGNGAASLPVYTSGGGPLGRQCTRDYKVRPIRRHLQKIRNGQPVTMILGISLDEFQRARTSDVKYITNEYPLLTWRMTRTDCIAWIKEHGYPEPPKSACYFCPYRSDRGWREMRENDPESWDRAIEFDRQVRDSRHNLRGSVYLHRSLVPLDMVDLSTPRERAADAGQVDMFDGECSGFTCMGAAS